MKIEEQLAKLAPKSFDDACCLLEFATDRAEPGGCMVSGTEIYMLRNVSKGLWDIWRDEMKKVRKEATTKAKADARNSCLLAFETIQMMNDRDERKSETA